MSRILALDVGDVRVGVAVSDPTWLLASSLTVLQRRPEDQDTVNAVLTLAEEQQAERILVGMPWRLDGTLGPQGEKVAAFVAALAARSSLPVETVDERFTTRMATNALLEGNTSRAKRKQVVDKVAAAIILQGWLDARRRP